MGLFSRKQKSIQQFEQKGAPTFSLMPRRSWTAKFRDFTDRQSIRDGLERSVWVYACIKMRSQNIASVPFVVKRWTGSEWEQDDQHPANRILDRPNPAYSFSEMIQRAIMMLDSSGDSFWSIVRAADDPRQMPYEVWPLIPDRMTVKPGEDAMVSQYKYEKSGYHREFRAYEILHLKYTHPGDLYYGLSPLVAAGRAVDIDEEAERWQKNSLENMAVPPFYIEAQDLNQQQYEQMKEWVRDQTGPDNARKPMILANGRMATVAFSATDLDFIQNRKITREEICAAYSVPPPLVGIYENATLSNIETARQILWREGLIPVLDEITAQINRQLAPAFGGDVKFAYDLTNVEALRENMTERLDDAQALWRLGVPLTEINRRLELNLDIDAIPGADIGYVPSGVFPAGFDADMDMPAGSNAIANEVMSDER